MNDLTITVNATADTQIELTFPVEMLDQGRNALIRLLTGTVPQDFNDVLALVLFQHVTNDGKNTGQILSLYGLTKMVEGRADTSVCLQKALESYFGLLITGRKG